MLTPAHLLTRQSSKALTSKTLICALLLGSLIGSSSWAITPEALTLYNKAHQAEEQGQLENALALYSQASHIAPQDALIQLHLGNVLKSMERYSEAMVHYQQAHKLSPTDPGILLQIGLTLEQLHEPLLAQNALLALRQKQPEYQYALYHLARLAQQQQQLPQAIEYYKEFLLAYPNHTDATRALARLYVVNQQPEQAIALFESLKRQNPTGFSDNLTLAKAHNLNNDPQKALQVLQGALNDTDTSANADVKAEVGFAHLALGQSGFALPYFEAAVQQDGDDPNIRLGLSRTYLNLNRPKDAIPHLNTYLTQYPTDLPVKQNLADAYVKAEMYDQALETENALLSALDAQPSTEATQAQRSAVLQQKGFTLHQLGQLDNAIATYTRLLNDPATPLSNEQRLQVQQNLALAHHQAGHLDAAITAYQTAYSSTPNPSPQLQDDMARAWLAKATEAMGNKQFSDAQTAIAQARAVASEGFTDADAVQAQLMAREYQVLHAAQPDNPTLLTHYEQADIALTQALAKSPNNRAVQLALAELYLNAPAQVAEPKPTPPQTSEAAETQPLAPPPATVAKHTLEAILAKDPDNAEALSLMAQWYIQHQQNDQAVNVLTHQWQRLKTSNVPRTQQAQIAYELANVYRQINQPSKAITWYQTATGLNPKLVYAHYNLGIVFSQQKQYTAARAAYQKALDIDPNFSDAIYGLAVSHDFLGDKRKAVDTYQSYLNSGQGVYAKAAQQRIELLMPEQATQSTVATPHTVTPKINGTPVDVNAVSQQIQPGQTTTFHVPGKHPVDINLNVGKVTVTPLTEETTATPAVEEPALDTTSPAADTLDNPYGLNTMNLRALPLDMLYQARPAN